MTLFLRFTVVLSIIVSGWCAGLNVSSPDGSLRMRWGVDAQGHLVYSVVQGDRVRLEEARAGLWLDGVDLGAGATLGEPVMRQISETFAWRGNKRLATNHCQAAEVPVRTGGRDWTLEVRVFRDGAAFRYRVPGSGTRRVRGESTAWQIPKDATVWFQTDTDDYEGNYQKALADQIPLEEEIESKKRSTHLGPPVTIEYRDGAIGMISEASLRGYSGMTLRPQGGAKFGIVFQDDPEGWNHEGPVVSPWRVLLVCADLNALVNSDVIPALCDPPDPGLFPKGMATEWLQPGKAPCTWMVFGNDGAQWHRQKWFVDLCAATGCEYLLVDAGWRSEKWGWLKDGGDVWARAAELCRYAADRKVGIFLWHAYPEGRDDSPGLTRAEAREELMRECQKAGVRGVKIDFFNSESKAVVEDCEDLLRRAAAHRLMVSFHGCNKPTGEVRTWPNEITREGIREQEYVLWSVLPLEHYGALPFTRMAAGHADFLPGYLQKRHLKNTTATFQMAATIVFSSPFLCWPDNPEAYLHSPWLSFVREVPANWDETRVLAGTRIGDTVLMARRRGEEWYVAALNCRAETRTLELDVSSLGVASKSLALYRDGSLPESSQIESGLKAPENGRLSVKCQAGGGFIARFGPQREFEGWK